jgi:hypothetical protein
MTSSNDFGSFGSTSTTGDHPLSGGYPAGGYIPPAPPADDIYRAPTTDDEPSTADVAKGQASAVAGGAADAASHVAGVAKEQAGQVTAEATRQVKHLVGQARTELSGQAQTQQERAATGLHSVGDQLKAMASGNGQPGVAADLAQQAADKVHEVAGWLENKEPADLLEDVRAYARRRPGMFLAIALGAGLVAGRLVRGATTDPDSIGKSDTPELDARSAYPAPAASGYLTTPPPLTAGSGYGTQGSEWASAPAGGLGDAR